MQRKIIPSLDDLRALEALARNGTIRSAAKELSLTHSAISKRVKKLSIDLDLSLLNQVGRGVELTSEAREICRITRRFFDELEPAILSMQGQDQNDPIVLSCERSLSLQWFIANLSEFQDTNPQIKINLSVGGGSLNFERDQVDIAIRRIDFDVNPNWIIEKAFDEMMGPIMSLENQKGFMDGDYVGLVTRTRLDAWDHFFSDNSDLPRPKEYLYFDHHFLMIEAACNGFGVAMAPSVLAKKDIDTNRIVAPLGFQPNGFYYGIIYEERHVKRQDFNLLIDWIKGLNS